LKDEDRFTLHPSPFILHPVASLLSVNSVTKTFDKRVVVRDLSFTVEPGEIFGLLGPNGAGKTTTIRMALDLFKPDSGAIEVFGGPMDDRKKDRIGYMPEERGLYGHMKLAECLEYMGALKGLPAKEARLRVEAALKRLNLWEHRKKKIEKLSRGMAQKAQIIAATLHDPDLLIVDGPFANLDPMNIGLIKHILLEMRARGKAIIMSSHQLHIVESLCDRILLIHGGGRVVYGALRDVKRQFAGRDVLIEGEGDFRGLPGAAACAQIAEGEWRLTLSESATPPPVVPRYCRAIRSASNSSLSDMRRALAEEYAYDTLDLTLTSISVEAMLTGKALGVMAAAFTPFLPGAILIAFGLPFLALSPAVSDIGLSLWPVIRIVALSAALLPPAFVASAALAMTLDSLSDLSDRGEQILSVVASVFGIVGVPVLAIAFSAPDSLLAVFFSLFPLIGWVSSLELKPSKLPAPGVVISSNAAPTSRWRMWIRHRC